MKRFISKESSGFFKSNSGESGNSKKSSDVSVKREEVKNPEVKNRQARSQVETVPDYNNIKAETIHLPKPQDKKDSN